MLRLISGRVALSPNFRSLSTATKEVKEVQIPVPWGHISGKWWGPADIQPLLSFHGWQDNCGSFDRLAPLLPQDVSLLTLDLPGHGLSSHYHPGRAYHLLEYVSTVRRIMIYYDFSKTSFLSHSLGSILSFVFSCVYNDKVDKFIAIDALKPYSFKPLTAIRKSGKCIDSLLKVYKFDDHKAPSYVYEEALMRLVKGTKNSITREVAGHLLERGLVQAEDGKYIYRRDSRLKVEQLGSWSHSTVLALASQIKCEVCHIVGNPGLVYDTLENHRDVNEAIKLAAKRYDQHIVEGTHHLHLTTPERIAPIINQFLKT